MTEDESLLKHTITEDIKRLVRLIGLSEVALFLAELLNK